MMPPIKEPKDPDGILWQRPLRDSARRNRLAEMKFELGFGVREGLFVVYYLSPKDTDLSIDIEESRTIRITLIQPREGFAWRWSTQFRAITRKRDPANRRHYKNLRYVAADGIETPWMNDLEGNYTTVMFHAKKGSHDPEAHGFSMNVDFKVPGTHDTWLPVTIDPDIINPKPGPGFALVQPLKDPERDDVLLFPLSAIAAGPADDDDESLDEGC